MFKDLNTLTDGEEKWGGIVVLVILVIAVGVFFFFSSLKNRNIDIEPTKVNDRLEEIGKHFRK